MLNELFTNIPIKTLLVYKITILLLQSLSSVYINHCEKQHL